MRRYRLLAQVGDKRIEGPWSTDRAIVEQDLAQVHLAQATGEPLRLSWLAVASGSEVSVAHLEEGFVAAPVAVRRRSLTDDLHDRPL
jgi:hypothetical protein